MHMADALLSPGTGIAMWAAAGTALAIASRRVGSRADDRLAPLMGMLGAFVFAAQMINFAVPGTGASGHLGGGLLLAILLGPHAAFIVIASVLTVQALFFADGGLLALGANMFNLGVLPCLLAYPLIYRPLAGAAPSGRRIMLAAVVAATAGLLLGALGVVLQTTISGISSLPSKTFLLLMLPIHLAIGITEGLATAAMLAFLRRARPDLLEGQPVPARAGSTRPLLVTLALAALLTAGVLSRFASTRPDGLEWSIARATGSGAATKPPGSLHAQLARLQQRLAWMPGYGLPTHPARPGVEAEKPLAGVAGGLTTLALVFAVGVGMRWRRVHRR